MTRSTGTGGDRLALMRLFVQVAETRSLAAAGRIIGLSQPSTSRQLRQLEARLGVQLVRRSTHDCSLTDAGERFLTTATDLLARWDAATEAARSGQGDLGGPIRVVAPIALGQTVLAQLASRFLIGHPAVVLDWRLDDNPGDLAAGGFDLWIRAGPIRDQSLIVHEILNAERTIVAARSFASVDHPADLHRYRAVRLATFVPLHVPLKAPDDSTTTLQLRPAFTTDNIYAALAAVREGVGYGVLPFWAVRSDLDDGRLVEVCPGWRPPAVVVSIAYPQARFRPTRVSAFADFIRKELLCMGERDFSAPRV